MGGDQAARKSANQDSGSYAHEDIPVHRAAFVMGAGAGNGSEHDAGQGCAEGQLLAVLRRDSVVWKNGQEHGHDDRAAAHAEQPGQNPDYGAAT